MQCKECRLIYQDNIEHSKYHAEYMQGIPFPAISEHVGKSFVDGDFIMIILQGSYAAARTTNQKLKGILTQLLDKVQSDLGAVEIPDQRLQGSKFYICKSKLSGRVHGMALVENMPDDKCGISRIWVEQVHRRKGIAKKLLRVVQDTFIFGSTVKASDIVFSQPTEMGAQLAASFNPDYQTYSE